MAAPSIILKSSFTTKAGTSPTGKNLTLFNHYFCNYCICQRILYKHNFANYPHCPTVVVLISSKRIPLSVPSFPICKQAYLCFYFFIHYKLRSSVRWTNHISIHKNHNIAWNNKALSLIARTQLYCIFCNERKG